MKCWKCRQENISGAVSCINCGTSLARTPVKTAVGKAMRDLYDSYGPQRILTETSYLKNGLGDYLDDSVKSKTLRGQIGTAMDAGLGRVYYEQIMHSQTDSRFLSRAKEILTRDCGFSDSTANTIMGYFDEMIGWKAAKSSAVLSDNKRRRSSAPKEKNDKPPIVPLTPVIPNKTCAKTNNVGLWILVLAAICIIGSMNITKGTQTETNTHLVESVSTNNHTYSELFTDDQILSIYNQLGIPNIEVSVSVGNPYYWEGAGLNVAEVDFYHNGEFCAGAACVVGTGDIATNISSYEE